jgi:hypothetical protein
MRMVMIEDGTYDAMIIDAHEDNEGVLHLELAVSSGAHRGEVLNVSTNNARRSWSDLIGTPATLIVRLGEPRIEFT